MNPDGLSYLDLATKALSGGPSELVNGYWSPGYPALISMAFFLFRPTPIQEFPLVHLVNFFVFVFALWSFSVFFRYWLAAIPDDESDEDKKRYVTPFAYCVFLWFTLRFIGTSVVTPDLGVAGIVFLAAGISSRLSLPGSGRKHYVALGIVLGAGYYFKAVMFPLGIAFLAILFFLPVSRNVTRRKLLWSVSTFFLAAMPLVAALSVRADRLTFGESGRLNYAWYATGLHENPEPNWIREHPAPKLLAKPLTLEFSAPIGGTYPLWYDPSYWYAGTKVRFDLRQQIAALEQTMRVYVAVLAVTIAFVSGALVLFVFILHDRLRPSVPRGFWCQLAWPMFACAMYALVHVEERFLGAFFVLFWLAIYGALMFRVSRRITVAVCATVLLTAAAPFAAQLSSEGFSAARQLVHPKSPDYQIAALGLQHLGLRNGDRLAIVGYAYNCYYARYARLRVAAQIPDAQEFWRLSKPELESVADRLASVGVRAVVAWNRPAGSASAGWKDVNVSDSAQLSVLLLSSDARIRPQ